MKYFIKNWKLIVFYTLRYYIEDVIVNNTLRKMKTSKLQLKPDNTLDNYQSVTPAIAEWDELNFKASRKVKNEIIEGITGKNEFVFVVLGGKIQFEVEGEFSKIIGERKNVFDGMPSAVYLSHDTNYKITIVSETAEIAYGWCKSDKKYPNKIIDPKKVNVEIRGGDNASRQINDIVPPGYECDKLVVVEVYTPSGNWSSYPPHKHDKHIVDKDNNLLEADLEEIYYYKIDKEDGYAIQQVYNDDKSLDEIIRAENDDLILVPEGYHPVVAAHGYNVYYLNFLVGSAQSLKASDDPKYAWIKTTWKDIDKRLPMVR